MDHRNLKHQMPSPREHQPYISPERIEQLTQTLKNYPRFAMFVLGLIVGALFAEQLRFLLGLTIGAMLLYHFLTPDR